MATFSFIPVLPPAIGTHTDTLFSGPLAAGTNTGEIVVGRRAVIRVFVSANATIRWGQQGQVTVPTVSDMALAPSFPELLDMGENDSIIVFSLDGAPTVNITRVSKS